MKYLITFFILFLAHESSYSQHYGGVYFSPNWVINDRSGSYYLGEDQNSYDLNFGYTMGYQGLLLENRRFSFSYGIQYGYENLEYRFTVPFSIHQNESDYTDIASNIITLQSIEIPLTWRYNILKGKKFQPYVSVATTFKFPFNTRYDLTYTDGSHEQVNVEKNQPWSIYFDLGIGVNYKVKDFIINVQPTIRPWKKYGKIGVGFSIMKKF